MRINAAHAHERYYNDEDDDGVFEDDGVEYDDGVFEDDDIFDDEEEAAERAAANEAARAKAAEKPLSPRLEKIIKWGILAMALFLVVELVGIFLVSPSLPLSRIDVNGLRALDRRTLLAHAGIVERSTSYLSIDPARIETALHTLPQVESARVRKRFPSFLSIDITAREALAVSPVQFDGHQGLAVFDKHGVIFKLGDGRDFEESGLPIITGLFTDELLPGRRPDLDCALFLRRLDQIRRNAPELLRLVSEIRVNRREFERFDLTLYPVYPRVRVLTASDLNETRLRYILLTVNLLLNREPRIQEIDFRAGTASYSVKEAPSG